MECNVVSNKLSPDGALKIFNPGLEYLVMEEWLIVKN